LKDILENGKLKKDRTGTGTISVFGRQIRHKMSEGFPLLTTKKMYFKGVITELLWFLRGDTNIKYLLDNDCHIWDGDAYKNFEKRYYKEFFNYETGSHNRLMSKDEFILNIKKDDVFAKKWGELGPVYGHGWRKWNDNIDQIANLINELKTNPDSRRLMVSAWNPSDLPNQVLPPCHYGFQVYTRELTFKERFELWEKLPNKDVMDFPIGSLENMTDEIYHNTLTQIGVPERSISLMYNTRSQDVPLGTPFNIASYALLLEIFGKMVNMVPDELISNMGDCHIYLNQVDGIKEQLGRNPYELPKLIHTKSDDFYKSLSEDFSLSVELQNTDFKLEGYMSHPTIKIPLSN
jgi:thymidylate synthase